MTVRRDNGDGGITQRPDGKWIVRVTEHGKRRYIGSSDDKNEAKRILKDHLKDRSAGLKANAGKWTLSAWLDVWLEEKKPQYDAAGHRIRGIEPTTWESYEIVARRHVKPFLGTVKLTDLSVEMVGQWLRDLNKKGRSAEVQRSAVTRLADALKLAYQRGYVVRNVASAELIERPEVPARQHVQPSEADLASLLRAIDNDPLEALVWIALGAGLRRAEVAGLWWEDVTFPADDRAVLHVHRRVNRLTKRVRNALSLDSTIVVRQGLKTQDMRLVPVVGPLVGILRKRWSFQLAQRLAAGSKWRGPAYVAEQRTGYLFTTPDGDPLVVDSISSYMTEVRERAGLDIDRFHALRRAFTTLLGAAGVSDRVNMDMTGHKTLEMNHYYQQPMETQKWAAAEALGGMLERLVSGS